MLAALLLAGIVAAPLGSAGLFAGARAHWDGHANPMTVAAG